MSKLHELLAVEGDLAAIFKKTSDEARTTFSSKAAHFLGFERHCEMFDSEEVAPPSEYQHRQTSVKDKLDYLGGHIGRYLNAVYQKEATNQEAKADLVIEGVTLSDLPATFLLSLETKLKGMRAIYEAIPTLAPGVEWIWDDAQNAYKASHPEEKMKTAKAFKSQVLYEATEHHPAQIERWEETVNVGRYTKHVWSGMISTAQKSELLGRLDNLLLAVKKARQRANSQEVVKHRNVGDLLVSYIHEG